MARVRNQHLGSLSGKLGDYIFRSKNSREGVVYLNKRFRKKPNTQGSIDNNKRFAVINKFASAVNKSVLLKYAWLSYRNIKGKRAYDKIQSFNYRNSNADYMNSFSVIVPKGIHCAVKGFRHDNSNFDIEIEPTDDFVSEYNGPFSAVVLIYLNSPLTSRKGREVLEHNSYILVEQDFDELILNGTSPINIKFDNYEDEFKIINDYRRVRVFFSLFFKDKNNNLRWTFSFSYLYKGFDLENEYIEKEKAKVKLRKEEEAKPVGKYKRLVKC